MSIFAILTRRHASAQQGNITHVTSHHQEASGSHHGHHLRHDRLLKWLLRTVDVVNQLKKRLRMATSSQLNPDRCGSTQCMHLISSRAHLALDLLVPIIPTALREVAYDAAQTKLPRKKVRPLAVGNLCAQRRKRALTSSRGTAGSGQQAYGHTFERRKIFHDLMGRSGSRASSHRGRCHWICGGAKVTRTASNGADP